MKTYNVWGSFQLQVDFDIEAETQEQAEMIAKQRIKDEYYLDAVGGIHVPKTGADFSRLYVDELDESED